MLVLRNHRRRLRLTKVVEILGRINTLQNNAKHLDTLIDEGDFCAAIALYRNSLLATEDFKFFGCVDSLQHRLRATHLKIDDALDDVLQASCENFNPRQYALVQKAFQRLGNTQTTVAQLQLHYTTVIHKRAATVVAGFTDSASSSEAIDCPTVEDYAKLCQTLPTSSLVVCLAALCRSFWNILVCYYRTALWHENATKEMTAHSPSEAEKNSEETNFDDVVGQWHGYVASKLGLNRGRIWMDISSRVRPLLATIASQGQNLTFEEIASTLNIVNRLVRVGEEFAGHVSFDLLEVLRSSIRQFFAAFHRKHMDRLRMFLENETWELCPVKPSFSLLDLHEFYPLADVLKSELISTESEDLTSHGKLFVEPYECHLFDLNTDSSISSYDNGLSNQNGISLDNNTSEKKGPILASTTIEVLRLIGRYLQMMRLLKPIASEVMHCIGQLFDYYLYVVHSLFGTQQAVNEPATAASSNQLPERLRKTISRISDRLIAPMGHPSVENGSRFAVPRCTAHPTEEEWAVAGTEEIRLALQRHVVGVESLIYLAKVLETDLLSHLRECLPESQQGLLVVFKEQSLVTALEVRDAAALQFAKKVFPRLLALIGGGDGNLRQMIAKNAGWASKDVAREPSAYLETVNAAIRRFSALIQSEVDSQQGLRSPVRIALWRGCMQWMSGELLEGLASVYDCSEEGRSQMLLDVQSAALLCESDSGIRPFVNLDVLVDYIQAFYVPTREWENWLVGGGGSKRYTQTQALGLAYCLSRGDKKTRQRLMATVTTVYSRSLQTPSLTQT